MEKKKGKVPLKLVEPVSYNRSILAAFEKQKKGKTCPLCQIKLSLAAYREHLDSCKISEDDEEIMITATYSREEAILRKAGPEIVLNEEDEGFHPEASTSGFIPPTPPPPAPTISDKEPTNQQEIENTPIKRRKTDDLLVSKEKPKEIKESPKSPEKAQAIRRRSARIQEIQVKTEVQSFEVIIKTIEAFEEPSKSGKKDEKGGFEIPYYVQFTMRVLKRVLTTRRFDNSFYDEKFWSKKDMLNIHRFVCLVSNKAKCLLVRLFLRRTGWYTVEKLKAKYPEITNFESAATELIKCQFLEDDSSLRDLDDALSLADVQILKSVAKKFKLDSSKGRPELIKAMKQFATSQMSIFGTVGNVGASILKCLKMELGTCLRIKKDIVDLLKAIFTIYCPTTTNSALSIENAKINVYQDMLYLMLQIQNSTVSFPPPSPCPNIASFYENREQIMGYVEAKNLETRMLERMASGAASPGLEAALELALQAKDQIDEMPKQLLAYFHGLPIYERKFTRLWVLARCCGHGATALEKIKKYGMAVEWQKYLLKSEAVAGCCTDIRGIWWDRLLLNLDAHLKERNECIRMIKEAMEDESILEKELLMIQDRAARILRADFVPKLIVEDPIKKTMSSRVLAKDLGDGRVNRFVMRNVGVEGDGEEVECSVEEVVRLRYFKEEGFTHGLHDEGASWHTLFGIIFYDIIFDFDAYPSTWLSEIQDCPIDMSNTLYSHRKERFDERFSWLENAKDEQICEMIRSIWTKKCQETNRECGWKLFADGLEDCIKFFGCIPREALVAIFGRLAENYRNCRSGFPDLTLWNPTTKSIAVVEVKGPGDRLSTKQRLWLAYFTKSGIRAEVCHVTAENDRKLN